MHTKNGQSATATIGESIIKPHTNTQICVGVYESCIPAPRFTVTTQPDIGDQLAVTMQQKQEFGDYTLIYTLQNNSDTTCHVTITEDEPDGSERVV